MNEVTIKNGWCLLLVMGAIGVIVAIVAQLCLLQNNIIFNTIQIFCFLCFIYCFVGGWVWMPVVFYYEIVRVKPE